MHPGNIFIAPDGTLVPIDFGIMGHLDFADRLFLARLLTAMLERDYDLVAQLHADAGMLGEDVPLAPFAQSIRAVAEPVMGKALGEVSLGTVLGQIQKTMMMAEGVARQLNPQADMWILARPLAGNWMREQANFVRRAESLIEDAMMLAARLPKLLTALEQRREPAPAPRAGPWPLILSALALTIAIASIFT